MKPLNTMLRLAAPAVAIAIPLGLWVGGAAPMAVGLIPSPWDKLVHATVFGTLAWCVATVLGARTRAVCLLAFLLAVAVGLADEWHQSSLPGRQAGLDDLLADAFGAALATLWIFRRHSTPNQLR